jgi:hypothetical protein
MTGATQATSAAGKAQLYRAKLPCRPWTPTQDAEMPLRKIHHPVGAYTAEEKKEFAE